MTKLTPAEAATLREMRSQSDRRCLYFFRRATCAALAAKGLAIAAPSRAHLKRPGYLITDAGREALTQGETR